MAYLEPDVKEAYEEELAFIDSILPSLRTALTSSASGDNFDIKKHEFDSGEGRQKIEKFDLKDIPDMIMKYTKRKAWLERVLNSGHARVMRVDRWHG